jgi:hypothetical protein
MKVQYVSESSSTEHVTISDWYRQFMKAEASSDNTLAGMKHLSKLSFAGTTVEGTL